MAGRKRGAPAAGEVNGGGGRGDAPEPKRRSSRQAAAAAAAAAAATATTAATAATAVSVSIAPGPKSVDAPPSRKTRKRDEPIKQGKRASRTAAQGVKPAKGDDAPARKRKKTLAAGDAAKAKPNGKSSSGSRFKPEPERPTDDSKPADANHPIDHDADSIPAVNPEAPRHEGEWYWLMKAEPETRLENGVDVSFSIDDLRAKTRPEGWDGIRAYAARNHMRSMNVGDKAFFYHSNCKEPGIAGIMEIVKEFSPDDSALRPGAPYYDAASTKESPRWSLVHVEFRRKFAVPIPLRELRDLGKPGGALEGMQMLRQSRLSVSRVSSAEWAALCRLADDKAAAAGLEHDDGREPRR